MTEKQEKLIDLLEEMFQLNQSDLDFGIYRIMNAKADEISTFLKKDLIGSIKEAFTSGNNDALKKELDELSGKDTVKGYLNGDDATKKAFENLEDVKRYLELTSKFSGATDATALENDVYSHLAAFFSRYYKDGDFVSLRRYKKDTYAIPYEGEEVKLHWANSDQYYIKTSEYFRDYTFKASTGSGLVEGEEKNIHFKLIDADTEANNNKASADKERRFVIYEENPVEVKDGELYIYFEYKAIGKEKQDKLNEKAIDKILEAGGIDDWMPLLKTKVPTEKNKDRTLLEKHLKSYTSRNSFDYFIHKDLGSFMNRELDFYIKNEMLYLDDIEEASTAKIEESLNKIKTFKTIARKIIAFLTQLEEFQKSLWLKKKFIIGTNYCITLDKIDEGYHEEILTNQAQLDEWKALFDVKVTTLEELKNEPYLVLDTKFFDIKFKNKLLSEFDNLDEEIDGVLINSENFGALNLLQERYKNQLEAIYIDPPYNTGEDEFIYKDNYKDSSWLSMMSNRLEYAKRLLSSNSSLMASINEEELFNLKILLDEILGINNYLTTATVKVRHDERILKGDKSIHEVTEQLLFYKTGVHFSPSKREVENTSIDEYIWVVEELIQNPRETVLGGKNVQLFSPTEYSLKKVAPDSNYFKRINIRGSLREGNSSGRYYVANIEPMFDTHRGFLFKVENIGADGLGYRYFFIPEASSTRRNGDYFQGIPLDKQDTKFVPYSNMLDFEKEFNRVGTEDGTVFRNGKKPTQFLQHLLTLNGVLHNMNATILDYFAGSGSTASSVISLNRNDGGKRKYILVEMGEYFNSVTKPRVTRVIYSDNWKDSKPQNKNGISQMFKYFQLESYEDTLNNLAFQRTENQTTALQGNKAVKEDYLLNYMLNYETNKSYLNIDYFFRPFDYKLNIVTGSAGETKETAIDLVETFNYLIGLKVKSRQFIKEFLVIEGENMKSEKILIIWREGNDNEALNHFFSRMDFSVYDREFDIIYVNGDNNLANLKKDEEHYKIKLIEEVFSNIYSIGIK